jgi:hypothetical protein
MNARLLPCPSCARHVRLSDAVCPFCAADLGALPRALPPARSPATRLSRAALFAFGTSAAALAACGGTAATTDPPIGLPAYGGPPVDSGPAADGDVDAPFVVDAAYGGPPPDSGDAGSDANENADADSGFAPLYGLPPP